jgi:hypothetical protein
MKYLLIFFLLGAFPPILSADNKATVSQNVRVPLIVNKNDLASFVGKRIRLIGIYRDPGKGGRYIDCGFVRVDIEDYSFEYKDSEGYLHPDLKDGDEIEFEGRLRYFPGSKTLVDDNILPIQDRARFITIEGNKYRIIDEKYSVGEAILISRRAQPVIPADVGHPHP